MRTCFRLHEPGQDGPGGEVEPARQVTARSERRGMMRFFSGCMSLPAIAVGLAALALAGCNVAVEQGPGYRPLPPRPGPQMCTMEYRPVCASRHGERRTFANACGARSAGYRIVDQGQCRGDGGGWGDRPDRPHRPNRPDRPDWSNRPDRPQACTREYRPVCAKRGNSMRSFGNACTARAANYRVIGQGNCR